MTCLEVSISDILHQELIEFMETKERSLGQDEIIELALKSYLSRSRLEQQVK